MDDEYGVESAPESSSDKEEVSLLDVSARKPINNQGSCWIYFVQQIFYQNCKHGTDHFICFSIAYRIEVNRKLWVSATLIWYDIVLQLEGHTQQGQSTDT